MKISLIVPCFNVQKFVSICYKSCLNVGVENFEIIFVDDCSEDNTAQEIGEICRLDSRVTLVRLPFNSGTFNARKQGFLKSTGDLIVFLDPDDQLDKDALAKILNNRGDLILFGVKCIPNKIWKRKTYLPDNGNRLNVIRDVFLRSGVIPKGNPGKAYSRQLVEKTYCAIGNIEERFIYAEDAVFFYVATFISKDISVIKERLYLYCENNTSITNSNSIEKCNYRLEQIEFALKKIREIKLENVDVFTVLCREAFVKSLMYDYITICCEKSFLMKDLNGIKFYAIEKMKNKFYLRDLIKFCCNIVYVKIF